MASIEISGNTYRSGTLGYVVGLHLYFVGFVGFILWYHVKSVPNAPLHSVFVWVAAVGLLVLLFGAVLVVYGWADNRV